MNTTPSAKWSNVIPWFLTIACTISLIALCIFLVRNIEWYKSSVFDGDFAKDGAYRMRAYDLHLSMIKRSVGLVSGFSIMFLGLGVSFFTLKRQTEIGMQAKGVSANLVTASPGIIAVTFGCLLIWGTIASKDSFGKYQAPGGDPGNAADSTGQSDGPKTYDQIMNNQ